MICVRFVRKEVLLLSFSPSNSSAKVSRRSDEGLRRLLAFGAVVVMLLCPIVFVITNNTTVLLATTIVGMPVSTVYSYYFKKTQ